MGRLPVKSKEDRLRDGGWLDKLKGGLSDAAFARKVSVISGEKISRFMVQNWRLGKNAIPQHIRNKLLSADFSETEQNRHDGSSPAAERLKSSPDDAERLAELLRYFAHFRNLGGEKYDHLLRQIRIFGKDIAVLRPELTRGEPTLAALNDIMAALERAIEQEQKKGE